jgi:hypothetical protein
MLRPAAGRRAARVRTAGPWGVGLPAPGLTAPGLRAVGRHSAGRVVAGLGCPGRRAWAGRTPPQARSASAASVVCPDRPATRCRGPPRGRPGACSPNRAPAAGGRQRRSRVGMRPRVPRRGPAGWRSGPGGPAAVASPRRGSGPAARPQPGRARTGPAPQPAARASVAAGPTGVAAVSAGEPPPNRTTGRRSCRWARRRYRPRPAGPWHPGPQRWCRGRLLGRRPSRARRGWLRRGWLRWRSARRVAPGHRLGPRRPGALLPAAGRPFGSSPPAP